MWLLIVLIVVTVLPFVLLKLDEVFGWGIWREPWSQEPTLRAPGLDWRLLLTDRAFIRLIISIVGLVGGGYIILSGAYSASTETTAGGVIGMVFGYWLK
jgi:hypothetical protein